MKVKNFFKTENGRFNSPTVERIDIVVEKGFAESPDPFGDYGEPSNLYEGEEYGDDAGW